MRVFAKSAFRYAGVDYPYGWQDLAQTLADTLVSAGYVSNSDVASNINIGNIKSTGGNTNFSQSIPGNNFVQSIIIKNTTSNPINLNIGTSAAASDVFTCNVAANQLLAISQPELGSSVFDSATTLYFSSLNWNGAVINVTTNIAGF